jgi:hypothetical protein
MRPSVAAGRLAALSILLAALPALTACGVREIAPHAISSAAEAAGRQSKIVPLDDAALRKLSENYDVEPQVIADTAPQVDSRQVWNNHIARVKNIYAAAQENSELTGAAIDVVCGLASGQRVDESLFLNAAGRLPPIRRQMLIKDTKELAQQFEEVLLTGNEKEKAAVALICYTYSILQH